ncbi:hypothetical protein D9613_010855 [Agrocybe pediades]|uniref:F-box domain-containing protein n=1 Tax=Agrocybe pediades TaxID=84607 RepID=A0A8H4QMP6_9AGAR|nr:hypothetical protein D9613_010855 [Agrocybe pediades]
MTVAIPASLYDTPSPSRQHMAASQVATPLDTLHPTLNVQHPDFELRLAVFEASDSMQATRNTSAIPTLHEDLLWKIFLEITNDARDPFIFPRPILTMRHCSQVCRHWRSLILSSSLIWGRLIDMDSFRRRTDNWMKEVVRRAGDAVLWVYAIVTDARLDLFLFTFLRENWRRVEMLLITDWTLSDGSARSLEQQQKMWTFLREPAPHLRWIMLSMCSPDSQKFLPTGLFADNAPLLSDLCISNTRYKFPTQASWIPNLSAVTFSDGFAVEEVLDALRKMPRLQYLKLYVNGSRLGVAGGSMIILPKLKMLHCLFVDFSRAGALLQDITPSTDCCLHAEVGPYAPPVYPHHSQHQRYEAVVAKYLVPHFSLHPPSFVVFEFGREISRVYDGHLYQQPPNRGFFFSLHTSYVPSCSLIKNLSASSCFSQVRSLQMRTFGAPFKLEELGIASFCSTFPFITTFSALEWILHALLQEPSTTATLFPALTTLQVPDIPRPEHGAFSGEPPHQQFIQLRKALGRPISVLEIPCTSPAIEARLDMSHLDVHIGLMVKWKFPGKDPEEYVCGSGHPERLRFDRKKW